MRTHSTETPGNTLLVVAAFVFVLMVHGALPGFGLPTLGQAIWTSAFAQAFADASPWALTSHMFGLPAPSAMAFGLAGARVAGWYITLGLHPADAYSAMVATWLLVSFASCRKLGRFVGLGSRMATLAAVLWLSMPIAWAHGGYSMVGIGIALLPFYFLCTASLLPAHGVRRRWAVVLALVGPVIAIFMDGYTFMMFAVGSTGMLAWVFLREPAARKQLLIFAGPMHVAGFVVAYLLFRAYIHGNGFPAESLDFFRAWGVDLSFVARPTQGQQWLWDTIGYSIYRDDTIYYGDYSVWTTTFCLPILLAGVIAWWAARRRSVLASGLLLVGIFAFYMALGPSLKIDARKPTVESAAVADAQQLMPPEAGPIHTGNARISVYLPGFNVMRAAYRWVALTLFCLWGVLVLALANERATRWRIWPWVMAALVLANLPHLGQSLMQARSQRDMFQAIDHDMVKPLKDLVPRGSTIAFAPYGNDFLGIYMAARAKTPSFNAGGDKNVALAQAYWPASMLSLGDPAIPGQEGAIVRFLLDKTGDAVVVPYADMLWSAHGWPCYRPGDCIADRRKAFAPAIAALKAIPIIQVDETPYFVVARLRPEYRKASMQATAEALAIGSIHYPIRTRSSYAMADMVLTRGWYPGEAEFTWSGATAILSLPVPASCRTDAMCSVTLNFSVFGAGGDRLPTVTFSDADHPDAPATAVRVSDPGEQHVSLPLRTGQPVNRINVSVSPAWSPRQLVGSPDERVLGIALSRIELKDGVSSD
ncbi:hypothetical protein FHW69_000447 [Luteibacter sp. Sphag1AF]|uniref:hypothetical protein n=1 Tax=Luteibacter sp. Sphag1AF TaxID=2587031 RepID=UPI00161F7CDF|nr:hypothetical protein [Luteibacter sp. Sphag1AF]MBB3225857.1 hypothetical protein [Luteibacter sp. Sphag1AF]